MIVREPLVFATYYYLREAPGDSLARREDLHRAFVEDARRMVQSVTGWMAMPAPSLPEIPVWTLTAPDDLQPLNKTTELKGATNATAWVGAYALRNMLLLRVVVVRSGEHEESAWPMLSEALGTMPNTPSWLHTTHYWCGMTPRLPEDLEAGRSLPIQTPFGVLSLGLEEPSHVLVYPDARVEARANRFLRTQAPYLDWYNVQARHRLDCYLDRAARATQDQQRALDQVVHAMQDWAAGIPQSGMNSLLPLHDQLITLEATYAEALDDLTATRAAARELGVLSAEYRTRLMQSGLWDAAPSVWAAQVDILNGYHMQIETDLAHIDTLLRRVETLLNSAHTRVGLLHSERTRLNMIMVVGIAVLLLLVLIVDTDISRMLLRFVVLLIASLVIWWGRRHWMSSGDE